MAETERINSSSILWSTAVKAADQTVEEFPAYEFSNGREFVEPTA